SARTCRPFGRRHRPFVSNRQTARALAPRVTLASHTGRTCRMALRTPTVDAGVGDSTPSNALRKRWLQLCAGILGMTMIANLQYGWTLFVNPIDNAHHWGLTAIQVAFTIFVLFETWLVPVEGYLVDRFGPSVMVGIGGVLVAAAWVVNAAAESLPMLYVGGALGGLGAGI